MLDLPIASGWVPVVAALLGGAAFVALLARRDRRWWHRVVPISAAVAVTVTTATVLFANHVWHPFADPVPTVAIMWIAVALTGLGLAIMRTSWRARLGAIVLTLLITLCGVLQVNAQFGAYPTLGAAMGVPLPNQVPASDVLLGPVKEPTTAATATPTLDVHATGIGTSTDATDPSTADGPTTTPPMPANGVLTSIAIPGAVSGFPARDAWIYLPPAYQVGSVTQLPVLLMLSGQPGEPRSWLDGGRLQQTMDTFAAAHQGVAPVVVLADWLSATTANTMCVDSAAAGNAFTYLTVDVPTWIKANLQIDPDPARWAVGGLSAGGTCALQLAVNAPAVYPSFLAFSPQRQPTLGNHRDTVSRLFNGDEAAFDAVDPLTVMASHSFPQSAGVLAVGESDNEYGSQVTALYDAARSAGMAAELLTIPGGHDFPFWASALEGSMPWLAARLGIG